MRFLLLIAAVFALSGCASTIDFLDRKVRESHSDYLGAGISRNGRFDQNLISHRPTRPDCDSPKSDAEKIGCKTETRLQAPDAEIFAVDPVTGRAFKTGEISFELPPGELP